MAETRTLRVIVVGNAKSAQKALRSLSGDADVMGNRVGKSGLKFGSTMTKIGKSAALGFGVAAGAAALFTYKVGAPYEQSLNKIQVLNDQTNAQMKGIAHRLESNAGGYAKLGLSVGDAAEGVVELSKAGVKLNDAMKAVDATMVLAKAGGMGVADASALVSNSMNVWRKNHLNAAQASNILANAANISSADVSDLAQSLQMASNVSASSGASFAQTNAMLAMLANAGMKGSDAGTSLKTMLLSLQAPNSTAVKGLKALGVSAFDSSGKARPLREVLGDLDKKFAGLTDQQRAKRLKQIFGADAYRAAKVIFGQHVGQFDAYTRKVQKAGAANRLAQSASKGLSGTVARLGAGLKSAGQIAYRALAPVANKALKPLADGLDRLIPKIAPAVKAFSHLLSGGGGGGKAGAELSKTFGAVKQFVVGLLPTFQKFGNQLKATLGPGLKQIGDLVVNQLLPAFRGVLPVLMPVAKFLLNVLGGAVIGVLKGAINIIKGLIKVVTGIFQVITGLVHGDFSQVWDGLKNIVGGALQAVWGVVQVWWNGSILGVFKKGALFLTKGIWKKLWDGLKSLGKQGVHGISTVIAKVFEFLTKPFRRAFTAVKDYVVNGWRYIRGKFSGGVGGIKAVLGRIIEVVTYPYRKAFSLAKNLVQNGISRLVEFFRGLPGKIKTVLGKVKDAVTGAFKSAGTWLLNAGKDVIRGLVKGLDSAKQWVIDKIKEIADHIPGWVKKRLGIASPSKVMAELAKWIPAGIAKGLTDSKSVAQMQKSLDALANMVTNMFKKGKITSHQKNSLLAIMRKHEAEILAAVKRRLALQGKLDRAQAELTRRQERLAALTEQKQSVIDSARSSAQDYGSLMGTLGQDDSEKNTVAAIMARFAKRLQAIQSFRSNFNALKQRGLSAALLAQIAGAGPDEGGLMAATLVRATSGQMSQLNDIGASIDFESNGLATEAGSVYDAQIKQAQASVNQQQQVVNNINVVVQGNVTAEKALAKTIAAEVREQMERINKRNGKK